MSDSANIARHLPLMAAQQPRTTALKVPRGRTRDGAIDYLSLTFAELDAEVDAWAAHLVASGVRRGDRVLVMVRQGLPLIAAAFALFKLGAVPVIIDPGMGLKSFLACVARSSPRVLLGIPAARLVSRIFRKPFRSVELRIAVSGQTTARLGSAGSPILNLKSQIVQNAATDLAAVLFTSGSTGAPKGVRYEHGMFAEQVRLIRDTYRIEPGEIDLPMLPIFALFNPALGMTTIVPEINPSRPARVDPEKIIQAIRQEGVTNSFGSPTLWRKIVAFSLKHQVALPSLRRVLIAGAPVSPRLFADLRRILPNGEAHSPYGATEALPVSTISAREVTDHENGTAVRTQQGAGTCVGRPVAGVEVKIIAITDSPIATLANARELPDRQIGEIIVRGAAVTREYDALPEATAASKIQDLKSQISNAASGGIWHRMGDTGYRDTQGRLWFCGRKAERVETATGPLYTEQCEPIFAAHPNVARCALIGIGAPGAQRPAIVVEPVDMDLIESGRQRREFVRALRALGAVQPLTAAIDTFYFHPGLPVDVRHNAKIHRLTLARWAAYHKPYQSEARK
jgi:acyl-CoA synthetase (AMP-forming)/AMP-acid ligase II